MNETGTNASKYLEAWHEEIGMKTWLRNLWRKKARPEQTRRTFRPQLEVLEDRLTPSGFTNLTDNLNGTHALVVGPNVNVSKTPDTIASTGLMESETQVAINPTNPGNIVGCSNNPNLPSQFSVYRSTDGGLNWQTTTINSANDGLGVPAPGQLPPGVRTDPTLKFDANGRLFIAYLFTADGSGITRLITARSDDGGASFLQFGARDIHHDNTFGLLGVDKPFLTTGPDGKGGQAVYIAYTRNIDKAVFSDQQIFVVGSNDGGNSYTAPLNVPNGTGLFAGPAVGPNGELYVVWHDMAFRSIDFAADLGGLWGTTHFGNATIIKPLRESYLNPKKPPADPTRGFDNGPSIDVSRGGLYPGRIYVTFTDTYNSGLLVNGNNTDIYLVASDDQGSHWTTVGAAGNVESSTGTDFMATVAVDPITGGVNVGYYTTDGLANTDVNFRLASSNDGGHSWSHNNLSTATSRASAMSDTNAFGDYEGLAAFGGTVHGMWTDNRAQTNDNEIMTATVFSRPLSNLAVINFGNTENVFRTGRDGNLYQEQYVPGNGWNWHVLSNPGVSIASSPVATLNHDKTGYNVYVIGTDANLYVEIFDSSGQPSGWSAYGSPPGVKPASNLAVVNYGSTENVFVIGTDGNLYRDAYGLNGVNRFVWQPSLGFPGGQRFYSDPAATLNHDGTGYNVYGIGTDGNLYVDIFDSSGRGSWNPTMGHPSGAPLGSDLALINYGNTENVFVSGADGNLYADHWDSTNGWRWNLTLGNGGFVGNTATPTSAMRAQSFPSARPMSSASPASAQPAYALDALFAELASDSGLRLPSWEAAPATGSGRGVQSHSSEATGTKGVPLSVSTARVAQDLLFARAAQRYQRGEPLDGLRMTEPPLLTTI